MKSRKPLKITQDDSGRVKFFGVLIYTLGGDELKLGFDSSPELHKPLSSTGYTPNKKTEDRDILACNNIIKDIGYTGFGDKSSRRKTFIIEHLPEKNAEIETGIENGDKFDILHGSATKIVNPFNIFDMWTRLEVSLGSKLSGHTDTLTKSNNPKVAFYRREDVQNEQQYRIA